MSSSAEKDSGKLLLNLINQKQPHNAIHIGSENFFLIECLCKAMDLVEESLLTIIPTYSNLDKVSDSLFEALNQLANKFPVETLKIPADKVLPDFYFQQQQIDFALLQPAFSFEQALVAFYYLDKMLLAGGCIVIPNANAPVMKRLCRQLIWEHGYVLHQENIKTQKTPLLTKAIRLGLKNVPKPVKNRLQDWIHPDVLDTEKQLNLSADLVILTKPATAKSVEGVDYEAQMNMDFDALLDSLMKE